MTLRPFLWQKQPAGQSTTQSLRGAGAQEGKQTDSGFSVSLQRPSRCARACRHAAS